jgi:hypothetical protein
MLLASEYRKVCQPWRTDHLPPDKPPLKYFVAMRDPIGAPFSVQIVHWASGWTRNHSAMILARPG